MKPHDVAFLNSRWEETSGILWHHHASQGSGYMMDAESGLDHESHTGHCLCISVFHVGKATEAANIVIIILYNYIII